MPSGASATSGTVAARAHQNAQKCVTPRITGTRSISLIYPESMPKLIESPSRVEAAGTKPKLIDEYIGRVNTGEGRVSVAHMRSPAGWLEPGQRPDFDEYTVVLDGWLRVEHEDGALDVQAGQAVLVPGGEWVRYSTPDGASYIAVCLPAFAPDTVHRDDG